MTVIAGAIVEGEIELSGDRQTNEDELVMRGPSKVWRSGGSVWGLAGDVAAEIKLRRIIEDARDPFVRSRAFEDWAMSIEVDGEWQLIAGTRSGDLWTVDHDGAIMRHRFAAIGCGAAMALPALRLALEFDCPEPTSRAVEAVCEHHAYCGLGIDTVILRGAA